MSESDIAAVRASANRLIAKADAARAFLARSANELEKIESGWQGQAAAAFHSTFDKHTTLLNRIIAQAHDAASEINRHADWMQSELDRERAEAAAAVLGNF